MSTLKKQVKISGVGIHSGDVVNVLIKPSKERGVFFRRVDLPGTELIPAVYDNVGCTFMRNTTIGNLNTEHVKTVEHLMAALFMVGIDSAIVEIDGAETPILDGSAGEFIAALKAAGTTKGKMKKIIVKREVVARADEIGTKLPWYLKLKFWLIYKVTGRKNDGYVKLSSNDGLGLDITATLVYREKIIGKQSYSYFYDETEKSINNFIENVACARTFGKYSEWEYLKKHGMGRGANESNVIALNDTGDGTINKTLWPDEFVRHKIVDAVGDMFTSGGIVCGKLESYKGSHALNNLVLKKLFSNPDNYDIINAE